MADPEQAVFALVNAARSDEGLRSLKRDPRLDQAARVHAQEMARYQYVSHTGRDGQAVDARARRAGYMDGSASYGVGENIATGYEDAKRAVEGWLLSPGHRANILYTDYTDTGISRVEDAHGVPHWVQVFGFQWPSGRARTPTPPQSPIPSAPPLPPPVDFSGVLTTLSRPQTPVFPAPPLPHDPWRRRQS